VNSKDGINLSPKEIKVIENIIKKYREFLIAVGNL